MEPADLVLLCQLFHECERDQEAIDTLHELISVDPVFDRDRRNLFHAIYKQVIDSLRAVLGLCQKYYEFEVSQHNDGHAEMLKGKREKNCARLLAVVTGGIEAIDSQLLPRAADTEAVVFFQRMKGDFFRYVAEYSDETESIEAENKAEEAYNRAVTLADQSLPRFSALRMGLLLGVAVFKFDIKKDTSGASEMLMNIVDEFDKTCETLSDKEIFEVREIIDIMRQNIEAW